MNRITKAPEERRSELVATAQELFFTKGYEHTSVSDIVKTIGVAQGTFYYYFESKEDVLEAITVNMVEELHARVLAIAEDPSMEPIEKWKRAVIASSDYKIGHRNEMLELLKASKTINNYQLRERYRQLSREKISQLFVDILNEGIQAGLFHTDYPEESAKIVMVIGKSISDDLKDILMNPEKYTDPVVIARNKFHAVQAAMERVLAAPQGSLKIVTEEMLKGWFGKPA